MPRRNNRKNIVAPGARSVLDNLKYEAADELNLPKELAQNNYWGNLSSAQCGAVGGHMVRKMIEAAERALCEKVAADVKAGFRAGLEGKLVPPQ